MRQLTKTAAKVLLSAGTLCAAIGFSSEAKADPRTHDGFYLQLGAGLGYMSTTAEVEALNVEYKYSSMTFPSALLLGGTVGPVVIGGGFTWDYGFSPSVEFDGEEQDLEGLTLTLVGVGLFADIYPNPNEGLHFQPFVGFGALSATYEGETSSNDPTGMILAVGVGYDFWVADEWSIGPMFRFAYAPLSRDDVSFNTIAPALLATFTYH